MYDTKNNWNKKLKFISRFITAGERIGKLEGRSGDNIQTEAQGNCGTENGEGHTVRV